MLHLTVKSDNSGVKINGQAVVLLFVHNVGDYAFQGGVFGGLGGAVVFDDIKNLQDLLFIGWDIYGSGC